jgi:acetyl/propionyl-CoA carboxylase alpha subunit
LITKLTVWGETRHQAIIRMRRALEEYKIVGIRTNIPFHQTMMDTYPFISGNYDTRFVEEQFSMIDATENREIYLDIAALMATLVAHGQIEHRSQVYQRGVNGSIWKWITRQGKQFR